MPEPRRVYLHIGLQKTGTSYLQGVMRRNQQLLADQGLDLVPDGRRESFELMLLVRGRYEPDRDPASVGTALDGFAGELRRAPGSRALLSQESLAAARPAQVRRLLAACDARETHVIMTVRDLARQLPSMWQQELKAGRTDDYTDYLHRMRTAHRSGRRSHPWIHLDPPGVLARWAEQVPAERIHVVTVPPPGSSTTLLLERFCRVLGVDPGPLVPQEAASNTSLGMAQAELLRRVNSGLPEELRHRQVYGDIGKRWFASQVLANQQGRKIRVPQELRSWCTEAADEQVAALGAAGYDVEGTLDDLRCRDSAFADETGPTPSADEVTTAAVQALVQVLTLRATGRRRRGGGSRARGPAGRVRRILARRRRASSPR